MIKVVDKAAGLKGALWCDCCTSCSFTCIHADLWWPLATSSPVQVTSPVLSSSFQPVKLKCDWAPTSDLTITAAASPKLRLHPRRETNDWYLQPISIHELKGLSVAPYLLSVVKLFSLSCPVMDNNDDRLQGLTAPPTGCSWITKRDFF